MPERTKATKNEANYRTGRGNRRCQNCTMFRPGLTSNTCTAVQGAINREDVCDYFKAKGGK